MKKLLLQLDINKHPSTFDTIVAYDGGADHVISHGGVTLPALNALVDGVIFTRVPRKNSAIFVGGDDIVASEEIFNAIPNCFFGDMRVSVMLDSNGCNTTAAAGVAKLLSNCNIKNKKVVILAGTGPVGRRVALMMKYEGAREIVLTSRKQQQVDDTCQYLKENFDVEAQGVVAVSNEDRAEVTKDANIVFSTGAAGVELLPSKFWKNNDNIEIIADSNATPPLGIGGIELSDSGIIRYKKYIWGALGFGNLKLMIHRACIARLFERNDQVIDAKVILELAKKMNK